MVKKGRIFRSRIELTVAHCKNLAYACMYIRVEFGHFFDQSEQVK